MPYRSPARVLAPLALVASVVAVYLVVHTGLRSSKDEPAPTTSVTTAALRRPARHTARTYVVKAGDTLSGIAQKTGIALEQLEQLNPDVDANTLRTGQKLKLRPAS